MNQPILTQTNAFKKLTALSGSFCKSDKHLKFLTKKKHRLDEFSLKIPGFLFDYSKQRVDHLVIENLILLSKETKAKDRFQQMTSGIVVNTTEKRAALHTAARAGSSTSTFYEGVNVSREISQINHKIEQFSQKIHDKKICGSTGKPFTDAVIIGIGGSYLGCEFVYHALKHYADPVINLHFIPNVDIDNFGQTIKEINPETCLWVIISKSYTTTETMANLKQALLYLNQHKLEPSQHLVTITSKGSPGDDPSNPVLDCFHMFDFIGGRYSVTSAVGGLPLSLAFGYSIFEELLNGCHVMDEHALMACEEKNIPLISALLSIWNSNFLNYSAQAIIPYSSALSKLAPHVQQVVMESLGKSVSSDGQPIDYQTGVIIFGEPGTNAQHSFFQLAHQGSPFPIEFIGMLHPVYDREQAKSKGVYNHQELWANMLAQSQALAIGKNDDDPAHVFQGNRPSSSLIINDVSPHSVGMLLAFYEARTVYEGFILGVNPFDQHGVELGKLLASNIRQEIEKKNQDAEYSFEIKDPATRFYLNLLFNGRL